MQLVTSRLYCGVRYGVHLKACSGACSSVCALGKPAIISEVGAGGGRHQLHVFLYLGNCISLFRQLAPLAPWENPCGLKQKHRMTFEKYDSVLLIVEGGCPSYSILATQFNPRQVL